MSRPSLAVALITSAGGLPLLAALLGWDWYLDGPAVLLVALAGGYAAGAWLPRVPAAVAVVLAVAALVVAAAVVGMVRYLRDAYESYLRTTKIIRADLAAVEI
ncbi:MAG: hypothetical protein ACRDUA_23380, partial [Micromonosporaceae bacterium]